MKRFWKSLANKSLWPLYLVVFLALFFRLYRFKSLLPMGHDQDLLSWIVKDIIADKHLRLIGQETSITGVFISPFYYYLNALSYFLFGMDQLGGVLAYTLISFLTVLSIYFVFNKFFGRWVGLLGGVFYAVTIGVTFLDRWVVPTQPTVLWTVWYLYILLNILKGNFKIILILAILLGFILHIHIAFIPFLILLPIAFYLSGKRISDLKKQVNLRILIFSVLIFLVLVSPFLLFEIRHGFTQSQTLLNATVADRGEATGFARLTNVFWTFTTSILAMFNLQGKNNWPLSFVLPLLLVIAPIFLKTRKLLTKSQFILIEVWILFNLVIQLLSKRTINEYYYNNLFVVIFLLASLLLVTLTKSKKGKILMGALIGIYVLCNLSSLLTFTSSGNGYLEKRQTVEFIKQNALMHSYPCVAINYIQKPGWASGFRYLYWKNDLKIITPGNDVPVYSIVVPAGLVEKKEIVETYGMIGIILPNNPTVDSAVCNNPDRQLLPPNGFTNAKDEIHRLHI